MAGNCSMAGNEISTARDGCYQRARCATAVSRETTIKLSDQAVARDVFDLVHGDGKATNLLFCEDKEECCDGAQSVAAVDFQYTGAGLGPEDVAYLLYPDTHRHYFDNEAALVDTCHETIIT